MDKDFLEKMRDVHDRILILRDTHKSFFENVSFKIEANNRDTSGAFAKIPGGNSTKAFILDFRPFLLQGEYLYIPSLCSEIRKNINDPDLIFSIDNFRKTWNKFVNGTNVGGVVMKVNGKEISVKDRIDLWLNGKFMHPTDKKKNKHMKLKEINKTPFGTMDYVIFIDVMQRLASTVIWLDEEIIKKIINKYDK